MRHITQRTKFRPWGNVGKASVRDFLRACLRCWRAMGSKWETMWPMGDQPGPSHSGSHTSFLAAGLPEQALNYLSSVQSLTSRVGNTLHACMKMPEENLLFCTLTLENSIKFNQEKTFLIILSLDIFLLVFWCGGGQIKGQQNVLGHHRMPR